MKDLRNSTLRDETIISKITEGLDLTKAEDIEQVYRDLQSGLYSFETQAGRDFDDHIYELHSKVLSGEIKDSSAYSGSANSGRVKNSGTNNKKNRATYHNNKTGVSKEPITSFDEDKVSYFLKL